LFFPHAFLLLLNPDYCSNFVTSCAVLLA
jgi:hypothetical protein